MMQSIEITFFADHAMITITNEKGITVRRMSNTHTLVWMYKQGVKYEWITLPDGTEQAVWEK